MACNLFKLNNVPINSIINLTVFTRHGHHLRGKPPGIARSLEQRLQELNYKDPALHYRVDISLPPPVYSRKNQLKERLKVLRENHKNPALEKTARDKSLSVNLGEVRKEWAKSCGPYHMKQIADHYGIFEHLFGEAYFYPRVPLTINYEDKDVSHPVFFGNVVKPSNALEKPTVSFDSEENDLWTLILTNPDGHLTDQSSEYIHWFVGNIPGGDIQKGETIAEYLRPFPLKGTGYHRHVFILFKQEKLVDFAKYKISGNSLDVRSFSTLEFYRALQDDVTPAGLAFFQADWDSSVTKFFHEMESLEPIFEYDFDPPYIRPQKWFAKKQPFNLYMDKYRDPKQINKEFLGRKLKKVHPFKKPEDPLPYPNAQYFEGYVPSWLKLEKQKSRLKWGRINDIE